MSRGMPIPVRGSRDRRSSNTHRSPGNSDLVLATSPRPSAPGLYNNPFIRRVTGTFRSSGTGDSGYASLGARKLSLRNFADGTGPHGLSCVHSPPEPVADLIFVHGLHGGSFRTWRKKEEKGYFWPGEWLPNDPDFENVRIHTFGYPADWNEFRGSILNVNDFGNSLHGAMVGSLQLNRGEKTPIIMIGHSMGGLVIKKACLMFHQASQAGENPHQSNLMERIRCLMFLATPHHGSDSAERLDRILRAAMMSSKDYVKDLKRESPSNQAINDQFRFIADAFLLYSFFESRPMQGLGIVVDKDSACIGGPKHEIIQAMDADHRSICKFDDEHDPNYNLIHDHLITAMDDFIGIESESEQLDSLEVYLDCEETQDETLETILERQVRGTCQWIKTRPHYIPWMEGTGEKVWLYWLHAPPGTGKSVMSASIMDAMKARDLSYFFFMDGNKFHRHVATLLRFLALQMAQRHTAIAAAIRNMQRENVHLDETDEKTLWKKLFQNCIFKIPLESTQYWVIDGLDECADALKLFQLLKSAKPDFHLRIFLTSRPSMDFRNQISQLSTAGWKCTEDKISHDDNGDDIRRLLRSKESMIPENETANERDSMLDKIAKKSQGNFLWATLVIQDMEYAWSTEDIEGILNDIPSEMVPHYATILEQMSLKHSRKIGLIQAMLRWAVCSARPLHTTELQMALKLDVRESIAGMQRTVEGLCGQILMINKHGAVQIIHSTARAYLLDKKNSSSTFFIKKEEGHRGLATTCLKFLAGEEMRPKGRLLTGLDTTTSIVERVSPFADYAATSFSLHLVNSPSDDENIFKLLVKFLDSPNVLTWIEYVAEKHKSLEHVKEAGSNLRRYLERRLKILSPLGDDYKLVDTWSIDLLRLVSKFGRNILEAPSRFSLLVPPMCPRNSRIYQQFSNQARDIHVVGIAEDFWADAISYIEHPESQPISLACGSAQFAIGKRNGLVRLFDVGTCQELTSAIHGEPATHVIFDNSGRRLVTSGQTRLTLWSLKDLSSPEIIWSRQIQHPCIDFFFTAEDDALFAVTADLAMLQLPLDDEEDDVTRIELDWRRLTDRPAASRATFSPDGAYLAIAHEGGPISVWSVDGGRFLGRCGRAHHTVESILFNPNPDFRFLVVTYKEGELALIDYDNLEEKKFISAEPYALAITPDGRTLATGDSKGNIQLWEFETLALLYRIRYNSSAVKDLMFSKDGLRILDLREKHSVVWEPAALIRHNEEEDATSSSGMSLSGRFHAGEVDDYGDPIEISSMAKHTCGCWAFVGKDDGSVCIYDMRTGEGHGEVLLLTRGSPVTSLLYHAGRSLVAAADPEGKVIVASIDSTGVPRITHTILTIDDFGDSVSQLVLSSSGNQLIVSGIKETQIWQVSENNNDNSTPLVTFQSPTSDCWRFFPCPDEADTFQLIDKNFIPTETGHAARKLKRTNTMDHDDARHVRIRRVVSDPDTGYLVVEYEGAKATTHLVILERTGQAPDPNSLSPPELSPFLPPHSPPPFSHSFRFLAHIKPSHIRMFLGIYNGAAVYLGPHLWVRTVNLRQLGLTKKLEERKNFFISHELIGGNHHVQAVVGSRGEIMFPRRGELVIVWDGIR